MSEIPTIAEAAKLIAAKQLSPVELTRACLDRVRRAGRRTARLRPADRRACAGGRARGRGGGHGRQVAGRCAASRSD